MNWTMGRYIGELDAEGRDRLIAAPEFSDGPWWENGCGCLVGTAMAWESLTEAEACRIEAEARRINAAAWRGVPNCGWNARVWAGRPAAHRYPTAVERFGKDRVVRAIKLRAARLNGSNAEQIAALLASTTPHPTNAALR